MKTGLFFGSFNPIHIGHLAVANYLSEFSDLDEIWLVISPQNPLKNSEDLLPEGHRYHMAKLALGEDLRIRPSDIEFSLPKPSYTVDTLAYLTEKYPDNQFAVILGSDNLVYLQKWKNYKELTEEYELYIYPRPDVDPTDFKDQYNIKIVDAPRLEISSSFIRNSIKEGKDIKYFLPPKVYEYITKMNFYKE